MIYINVSIKAIFPHNPPNIFKVTARACFSSIALLVYIYPWSMCRVFNVYTCNLLFSVGLMLSL